MARNSIKLQKRLKRKKSIRKKIAGTNDRPRLSVYRSARHIYAELIDDTEGRTLAAASTLSKEITVKATGNIEAAKKVGELLSKRAQSKNIKTVTFDRNGFLYHGRVKALAEAVRGCGLEL